MKENQEKPLSSNNLKTTEPLSTFEEDFIIISEFSEIVGPMVLEIYPPESSGSFDLQSFVLKIHTSDHQAKSNSGLFGEDAQVVKKMK